MRYLAYEEGNFWVVEFINSNGKVIWSESYQTLEEVCSSFVGLDLEVVK